MKKTTCILLLALIMSMLAACGSKKSQDEITSLAQLNETGRKIGVVTETNDDKLAAQKMPKAELVFFKDEISGYIAVQQGKIDAFVFNSINIENAIYQGMDGVRLLDESMGVAHTSGVAISPVSQKSDWCR